MSVAIIGAYKDYQLVTLSRQPSSNAVHAGIFKGFDLLAYVFMHEGGNIEVQKADQHKTHFFPMKPSALVEKMVLADV